MAGLDPAIQADTGSGGLLPVIAGGAKQSKVMDDALDRHGAYRASR